MSEKNIEILERVLNSKLNQRMNKLEKKSINSRKEINDLHQSYVNISVDIEYYEYEENEKKKSFNVEFFYNTEKNKFTIDFEDNSLKKSSLLAIKPNERLKISNSDLKLCPKTKKNDEKTEETKSQNFKTVDVKVVNGKKIQEENFNNVQETVEHNVKNREFETITKKIENRNGKKVLVIQKKVKKIEKKIDIISTVEKKKKVISEKKK